MTNTEILFAVSLFVMTGSFVNADEYSRSAGDPYGAATSKLMYTPVTEAATIPVFNGRIAACLLGCRRPVPVVYYAPVPVYQGCVGGFGGGSWPVPAAPLEYSARPAPAYSSVPSYAYRAPTAPYRLPPSQAIVSLPRLGLTFSFGDDNGLTVGRSSIGNPLNERIAPQSESPALPPIEPRSEQFQYDGGPSNPIPMPRSIRPQPQVEPRTAPSIDNRAKSNSAATTWTAYGDKPKRIPPTNSLLAHPRAR